MSYLFNRLWFWRECVCIQYFIGKDMVMWKQVYKFFGVAKYIIYIIDIGKSIYSMFYWLKKVMYIWK